MTIICPYCQATTQQSNAGKTQAGFQQYRCGYCGREYTLQTARLANARMRFLHKPVFSDLKPAAVSVEVQTDTQAVTLPVAAGRSRFPTMAASADRDSRWGWLPEITLLQSAGLFLLACSFTEARTGALWAEVFFWISLAILMVPVAVRLYSTSASRRERIGLILLLGAFLYVAKVMHSPYAFTFPDELSGFRNVREILENRHLFQENPELPVTALYPGLATITSLLASLSGLSIFPAGLLVISAARLVLFLSLFLLYEQVSGSARIAGLATLLYMANANFLFYTAEFSYESLALPVAVFVLYVVARREMTNHDRRALTIVALFGILLVVISHHVTSYILTGLLFAAAGISVARTRGKQSGPWDLAIVAALAAGLWLMAVATKTIAYLSPVFTQAFGSMVRLATQQETSRQLFRSTSSGYVSPLWEKLTVVCAVAMIAAGLPVGSWSIWRRYRNQIFCLLLGLVALAYLPMQGLRLTAEGWETANRSSEFLFIGIGLVLALAIDQFLQLRWLRWGSRWVLPVIVLVLFFGGFISGWSPEFRLPRPYLVASGPYIVEPQAVQVAKWASDYLGPDHHIATSKVDAKLLSAYAEENPFTGDAYGIHDMLFSKSVGPSEIGILRKADIEYILSERRLISWDQMIGLFFFNEKTTPIYDRIEVPTFQKFDGVKGVNRILDSGDIVIYDVRIYLPPQVNQPVQLVKDQGRRYPWVCGGLLPICQ